MSRYNIIYKLFLFSVISYSGVAQVSFDRQDVELPRGSFFMSFTDVNGDKKDDLIVLSEPRNTDIYIQTINRGMQHARNIVSSGMADWTIAVADYDNNNSQEILTTGYYNGINKFTLDDPVTQAYTSETISNIALFAQASNSVDIDNDGFLDYFVCHDDGDSQVYMNDGSGNLSLDPDRIPWVKTNQIYDGSGNYGSLWIDIENDGDLDLYIAKCRSHADDPTDLRRINQLYVNDGENNFTEQAASFNLDIGLQSWTADFGDIDNDGDLDCFITNHDGPHMLLENNGMGAFISLDLFAGEALEDFAFQGFFADFDNDGFLDILVSGQSNYFLWNNGDKTFTKNITDFSEVLVKSFSIGDANDDGFLDILTSSPQSFTKPSRPNVLYHNHKNSNNYLAISLQGTTSNIDGVGARVDIYGAWGVQTRTIVSGSGYGIVNSLTARYGLGEAGIIDSAVIHWPSGQIDVIEDLEINNHYLTVENGCTARLTTDNNLVYKDVICENQAPSFVTTTNTVDNISWNSGASSDSIIGIDTGFYNATYNLLDGCNLRTETVYIGNFDTPKLDLIYATNTACVGDTLDFEVSENSFISWYDGSEDLELSVTENSEIYYLAKSVCDTLESIKIDVVFLDPESVRDSTIEGITGQDIKIVLPYDDPIWYEDENLEEIVYQGNTLDLAEVEEDLVYYVTTKEELITESVVAGESPTEFDAYSSNFINNAMIFDVDRDIILEKVTIRTDTVGERRIICVTEDGTILGSKNVMIENPGDHILDLQFYIPAGKAYELTTDAEFNVSTLGYNSPRFSRRKFFNEYPYALADYGEIVTSNQGEDYYYYFYDWTVTIPAIECESAAGEIRVNVEMSATSNLQSLKERLFRPNPSSKNIEIIHYTADLKAVYFYNLSGAFVKESTGSSVIDISDLSAGVYLTKLDYGHYVSYEKLVVER